LRNISIFGTSSDAGKSTITLLISRIIQDLGYSVAPFKAQNVSNNAVVADDESEIAVAQYFQAKALNITTSYHLNPVLLKSAKGSRTYLIVEGKVVKTQSVREYYRDIAKLQPVVEESFLHLDSRYDCVVAEGAGSPVELNLMDKDLSNIFVATRFNTKIILVADIEKGGVFASIYGVYNLLPKALQKNVIGVIINKFRGDISLFDRGVEIIENKFKIPVLGVLPYVPFNLGFEDSQSLLNYQQIRGNIKRRVGVILYPHLSNYNDLEPLILDPEVEVEFIRSSIDLEQFDEIILLGSKLVIEDLEWLKRVGLFDRLKRTKSNIIGICGGFEMMFKRLIDEFGVESNRGAVVEGLGFIDDDIIFKREKIVRRSIYNIFGRVVDGFEIHHGVSRNYPLYFEDKNIKGTFIHGIFEDERFNIRKKRIIDGFIEQMRERVDMDLFLKSISI
jgi:adenosylcobyric acid synthase